jgi:hypothetical protein
MNVKLRAVLLGIGALLAATSHLQAAPTRARVLAEWRQYANTPDPSSGVRANEQVFVREVEDALDEADHGNVARLLALRTQTCGGFNGSRAAAQQYEESKTRLSPDLQEQVRRSADLCDLLDAELLPKGAAIGPTADELLAIVHTDQPFPDNSFESSQHCRGAGGCDEKQYFNQYCLAQLERLDADARVCEGMSCAATTLLTAQVEQECLTPPQEAVEYVRRYQQGALSPVKRAAGFAAYVAAIARTRMPATAATSQRCLAQSRATARCSYPSETATAFDAYRAKLVDTKQRFGAVLAKYFGEVSTTLDKELQLLDAKAAEAQNRCTVPADGVHIAPRDFYAANGCVDLNMPTTKLKEFQVTYEAAWGKHVEQESEKAQEQAAVLGEKKSRADKEARDRADAFQRQAQAKMASRQCKVAEAWAQYCDTSDRLSVVEASIVHQQRVDAASGTIDLRAKRQLAETKLVLEDQLAANSKPMAGLGVKATRGECKASNARSQTVQDACVLAAATPDPPIATTAPSATGAVTPSFTISIRDKDGNAFAAELSVDGPGGKRIVTRKPDDGGLASALFPNDFGGKLVAGLYRWKAAVGGVEIVSGSFEVSKDGKSILERGEVKWSKRPPQGTWQAASHAGD